MGLAVEDDVSRVTKDDFERMVQSVTVGLVSLVAELQITECCKELWNRRIRQIAILQ